MAAPQMEMQLWRRGAAERRAVPARSTGRAHAAGGAVERRSGGARAVASRELQLGVRVRVG